MSAVSRGESVLLSGPPYNMKARVHLSVGKERVIALRMHSRGATSEHRAYVRKAGGDASEIRLKLPHATPAGTYKGEATFGGETHAVVIDVMPVLRVRVVPRQTVVDVEPGGRAEFEVQFTNNGNVVVDLPKARQFDLDNEEGQDRALGRSLRAGLGEGESRVERFFEELRESHGGEARVILLEGAGALEPGDTRRVRCQVDVPMTVRPGRSYAGGWQIGNASHLIIVQVMDPGPRASGRKTQ
jgi:hypothetical protein